MRNRRSRFKSKSFKIQKASGDYEKFSPTKFKRSLRRAGLPVKSCEGICEEVTKNIRPGQSTKDIFAKSYQLIKHESPLAAVHYSLKRSLIEMGPTGYTFEVYMAKFFEELGYNTQIRQIRNGRCVTHELDVLATSADAYILMECKFHNRLGKKNDVKIPLYVKARRDDLNEAPNSKRFTELWIASNTAFSEDAIKYSSCQNIKLLGVNCPKEEPLLEKIRQMKLYPITSLKRLKKHHLQTLIDANILLCKEIPLNVDKLQKLGLSANEISLLLKDTSYLLRES